KGSLSTLSLMANGIAGVDVWKLRPYVGVGLGMARHNGKFDAQSYTIDGTEYAFSETSEDDYVFAYQVMAGVEYPFSDAMAVKGGYRYFATSQANFKGLKASYGTHNFEVGVLFRF
ncbi:MAG: outer membrane beta-barrel protein, partial [Rhodospirillaceae bacterium]|nr:outer membrane beta-barrel protein [Rhodospirillaceae bacterium]